jgi:hypothetical protein
LFFGHIKSFIHGFTAFFLACLIEIAKFGTKFIISRLSVAFGFGTGGFYFFSDSIFGISNFFFNGFCDVLGISFSFF